MNRLLILSSVLFATVTSAQADMTHRYGGRFGVAYENGPTNPDGRTQALYEGFYSTQVTHQADNGLRFRFELDIVVGNINDPRPVHMQYPRQDDQPRRW